jgi:pimeloyl-ACP methyl ester carboxylesterase
MGATGVTTEAVNESTSPMPIVDRAFVRLPSGLVHYRSARPPARSSRVPAYLAHSGPGSSAGLVPLIGELARSRFVIAPDMPGNGQSEAPRREKTTVDDYVEVAIEFLDALDLPQVDFYGQHSGAHIGCELALRHPGRVRRLVLDGIALFDDAEKSSMRERYAPRVLPDEHGGHLAWAWHFVDGLAVHFPYYLRDPAHRLHASAVPPAAARHALVVDLLGSLSTYHLAYQAVFDHPTAARLPGITHRTLVMAVDGDPLARYLGAAAALVPGATRALVARDRRTGTVQEFLDATDTV